jgi:hypothetical protein
MGKAQAKSGGNSRIRVVMVEADLAEGELSQLIPALQNALRAPAPTVQRISPPASPKAIAQQPQEAELEPAIEEEDVQVDLAPETPRQRAPRKPAPTPNVIDIEMHEGVSFASFAQGKDAKSNHKRYLIAAAWLKEHRGIEAASDDHIYTCYLSIGWPTNIPDFAQPLRELKARGFFTQPKRGLYAINHIGLDRVKKLNGGQ